MSDDAASDLTVGARRNLVHSQRRLPVPRPQENLTLPSLPRPHTRRSKSLRPLARRAARNMRHKCSCPGSGTTSNVRVRRDDSSVSRKSVRGGIKTNNIPAACAQSLSSLSQCWSMTNSRMMSRSAYRCLQLRSACKSSLVRTDVAARSSR